MIKISILGCGWLGFPLAKALIEKGFEVNGSVTTTAKFPVLENALIVPCAITLHEDKIDGDIVAFLSNSEILIIDIPPKLRGAEKENFISKISMLIPFIENSPVMKVLFISSISVYDDNAAITEKTKPRPDSESGKQLLLAEQLLQESTAFQTTVLRFGGLIGEDRHPIHFLAGKTALENPDAPVNLIHQKDCIAIILHLIEKNLWGETLNAVAPFHPTRKEYYTQKAETLHLALPVFQEQNRVSGRVFSENILENRFGYQFLCPNL